MAEPGELPVVPVVVGRADLQRVIESLLSRGYRVVGPTNVNKALIHDDVSCVEDFPSGWHDVQAPGAYRLKRNGNPDELFGYAVGASSLKTFLYLPSQRLWSVNKNDDRLQIAQEDPEPRKTAFFGARPCEVEAALIQDKVLMQGPYEDSHYRRLRENCFIVAVNCTSPAETCFCASMDTGPKARSGFDLALTEIAGKKDHLFLVEVGTEKGGEILAEVPHRPATPEETNAARKLLEAAAKKMKRSIETSELPSLLSRNFENPRWDEVASRCLGCGNCTQVCPTCFCSNFEDSTSLDGGTAERRRRWDSCFTIGFSYIHGGSVRSSGKSRYRQWMTHKLGNWVDQFGTSGCVGCGRCITWCPVGIDITEEARVIRETDIRKKSGGMEEVRIR